MVDAVCVELVSAEFPVKQGKYREFYPKTSHDRRLILKNASNSAAFQPKVQFNGRLVSGNLAKGFRGTGAR